MNLVHFLDGILIAGSCFLLLVLVFHFFQFIFALSKSSSIVSLTTTPLSLFHVSFEL